jgi:hypothetical protein
LLPRNALISPLRPPGIREPAAFPQGPPPARSHRRR